MSRCGHRLPAAGLARRAGVRGTRRLARDVAHRCRRVAAVPAVEPAHRARRQVVERRRAVAVARRTVSTWRALGGCWRGVAATSGLVVVAGAHAEQALLQFAIAGEHAAQASPAPAGR